MNISTTRKPRGNCLLKNLPSDRQDAIFEYLDGSPDEKGHTYAQCVAWLKEQKIETNKTQLCNWRQWYIFRLRLKWCEEAARMTLEANLGEEKISDEELSRRGNRIFSLLAVRTCDDKAWSRAQTLVQRNKRIGQIERKMEFELRRYEASAAREKEKQAEAKPKLTPDEVQERIRQIMGTE
jgi:aldehyde:ferredoxin oxidoreductase